MPGQDDRERGYWRDVGTIDSYYAANMDLIAPLPVFNLYNDEWPVYTYHGADPPAKVSRGPAWEPSYVDGCLLCQGSIVSGAHVERSIIAPGCYVVHDAHVTDCILFPGVHVGAGARLHRCIIDKNVEVPDWYRIGHEPDDDREQFTVSDTGIAVIEKDRKLTRLGIRSGVRARNSRCRSSRRATTTGAKASTSSGADDDVAEAELLAPAQQASR